MVFYWILAIFVLLLGFLSEFVEDRIFKKVLIFSIFFIMFLVSAFRVNIGTDYDGHYALYKVICGSRSTTALTEPLFYFLCKLFNFIGIGYYGVVFSISFLTIFPLYYIAKEESSAIILVLYFFLTYLISFSLMRQFSGVSLSLLGTYLYIKQEKKIKGIIFLLLACFMHSSLWLYFFCFIVGGLIRLDLRTTAIASIIIFFLSMYIDLISILRLLLIRTKYGYYFEMVDSNFSQTKVGSGIGVIVRFLIYFIELYYLKTVNQKNNYRFNFCFIILLVSDLLSLKILIFLRLRYVFLSLSYFPFVYKKDFIIKRKNYLLMSSWLFIFICLFYVMTFPATAEWGNIPYQSVFFTPIKEF